MAWDGKQTNSYLKWFGLARFENRKYLLCVYFILWDHVFFSVSVDFFPRFVFFGLYFFATIVFIISMKRYDNDWTLWFLNRCFFSLSRLVLILRFHLHCLAVRTVKIQTTEWFSFSSKHFLQFTCSETKRLMCPSSQPRPSSIKKALLYAKPQKKTETQQKREHL